MSSDSHTQPNAESSAKPAETRRTVTGGDSVADGQRVGDAQALPERFGRYRIVRRLGHGAMGEVYLAHDEQLDREVALKVPRFSATGDEQHIERFYREARSAATIRHPNLCPIHDVGDVDGRPFLTMAYIDGRPLSAFIRPGKPVSSRQAAIIVRKLARGLAAAHDKNVTHRDLKPDNIMIDERNEPIVMDFGLAQRECENEPQLTQAGTLLGTPAYMSPEQVLGDIDNVGPAADVYSLGVILYELLTGDLPFQGPVAAVLAQVLKDEPKPPSKFNRNLEPELETICLKAMAKNREDRYPSMDAMHEALTAYLRQTTGTSGSMNAIPATESVPGQHRQTVAAASPQRTISSGKAHKPATDSGNKRNWQLLVAGALGLLVVAGAIIHFATRDSSDGPKPDNIGETGNGVATNTGAAQGNGDVEDDIPVTGSDDVTEDTGNKNGAGEQPKPGNGPFREFVGHTRPVWSVCFSYDGTRLLTTSGSRRDNADSTVRLWNVETGEEIRKLEGHIGTVSSALFSRDGRRALSGATDGTMRLWDLDSGKLLTSMQLDKARGRRAFVKFSSNEESVLAIAAGSMYLFKAADGKHRRTFPMKQLQNDQVGVNISATGSGIILTSGKHGHVLAR